MRKPLVNIDEVVKRRANLKKALKRQGEDPEKSVIILFSNTELIRNHDVTYPFRQETNFFYMTGFEEPDSIFLFRPGADKEAVLFVREKNKEREIWDGFRFGLDGAKSEFQMDASFSIDDFDKVAQNFLEGRETLFYSLYHRRDSDLKVQNLLTGVRKKEKRSGKGNLSIKDPCYLFGEMRLIKSNYELGLLRKAVEISSEAHVEVMRKTHPGINEAALQGVFFQEIMKKGAQREGYGSILASGNNATTLHYVFNDSICRKGDLLLVDAGAEYKYYTGDISRTYPVNGKFSSDQRDLYQSLLDIQKTIISEIKPGVEFKSLGDMAVEKLTELMIEKNLLNGSLKDLISQQAYRKYYPHGLGHWLGSDVHDAGQYSICGEARKFEKGMVFTIEPGIYISAEDKTAPENLRGMGIRIEDNILVTAESYENLSSNVPKEIDELESIIGSDL